MIGKTGMVMRRPVQWNTERSRTTKASALMLGAVGMTFGWLLACAQALQVPTPPTPPQLPAAPRTEAQSVEMVVNTPTVTNFSPKSERVLPNTTVAVLEIQDPRGGQTGSGGGALMSDALAIAFRGKHMTVVERQRLDQLLKEQGLGVKSGEVSAEQAKRIGLLANADYLLAGALTEYSSETRDIQVGRVITKEERDRYARDYETWKTENEQYQQAYGRYRTDFTRYANITILNPAQRQLALQQVNQGNKVAAAKTLDEIEDDLSSRGRRTALATVSNIGVTLRVFNVKSGNIVWVGQASKRHMSLQEGLKILTDKIVEDFLRD